MSLRDLGFDFGPDPFGDKALAAKLDAFFHSADFLILCGLAAICAGYWMWVLWRKRVDGRDAVLIGEGREVQLALRRVQALKDLKARDQYYDEALFLKRAEKAFLRVQDAVSRGDLSGARAFVSDGMQERLRRQLAEHDAEGVHDVMRETKVEGSNVLGYAAGAHYDSISVRFNVSSARARLEEATGAVLDDEDGRYEEIWTFLRRPSAKTFAQEGAIEGRCPSCGMALEIVDAAQCAACKTWLNSGEHDWVAVLSAVPWEWRFPDPLRDVTGWPVMREQDADLSLESLEDRAAVVFWRWMDARRRRDAAPLRGVLTAECLKALAFDEGFSPGALLGAAEVVAFETGDKLDAAHVQLRWEEAGGERHTDYLIFRRRSGAVSDWKAGLSATRCPGCGAAPEQVDAEKCAYCGLAFNDGSRGWVVSSIEPFGVWKRPEEAPGTSALPSLQWGDDVPAADAVAAMAACLAADGAVHFKELAYLDQYAERRGMSAEQVEKIVASAREGSLPYDPPAGEDLSLLRGLVRMSLADGHIEDSERALLATAARRAGLHDLELAAMIKEERSALAARAKGLVDRIG